MKLSKSLTVSEHDHQVAVIDWFARQYPKLDRLLFAVPNASKRSYALAAYMRAEGLKAGTCDLVLLVPRKSYSGLLIELKSLSKTAKASAEQIAFLEAASEQGYMAVICKGADAAIETIRNYLS